MIFILEKEPENNLCKMAAILFLSQRVSELFFRSCLFPSLGCPWSGECFLQ